ncbi:UDP-N-acetyl-D-glucosamine dehydrogenase [Candidatus Roizmanbacteria bacterium CG22_combo_CG10-13_8_21_14_all_38_20]|uniref:UDP-N-acetyl-D-glucosamine dehydrogenase n=1 Tax=Candidatus Roizmanbacteria bacterium CG22_combo_CG10-13_8_21_14_all_38_20 TaxID=1974862 RepID=A0A2H0BWD6_9BACT|nr:MAG: UDP-N-acetyl-D-glucosamine dehydrogenase [Candidatus Roizmanbacteria bacterium CG22_combo_CG10-13_8_21_14_all_38_20]PJC32074.1 MAG: UDP-N-acetyl-D-glucosamine dehydrogenase [Candidatus Roizmanbacteria bacterium CG_4_9_14_0_2_um_filter_38_17]
MYKLLKDKLENKQATIGVIGLGYVGLPLAVLLARKGYKVQGFIRNQDKVNQLNKGENELGDESLTESLKSELKKGNLSVSTLSKDKLVSCDVYMVCVPTPVTEDKKPDLTALVSVAAHFKELDLAGKLIINESTVAPTMTRAVFGELSDVEYFLACSPERIDPGNGLKEVSNIAKVLGGLNENSLQLAYVLYKQILSADVVTVSSLEAAEMTKMLENTYRAVNIALINEVAQLCEMLDLDVLEIVKAASSKWSFHAHYPGVGVGGHCIPVDPYYLLKLAKENQLEMNVVRQSLLTNESMPTKFAQMIKSEYKDGMKVLLYGVTYKKDVADIRESPVLELMKILKEMKIEFMIYDPVLSDAELKRLDITNAKLQVVDMLIVGTGHTALGMDYKKLVRDNTVVIDGRNFFLNKVGRSVVGVGRRLL